MKNKKSLLSLVILMVLLAFSSVPSWAADSADIPVTDNAVLAVDINSGTDAPKYTAEFDGSRPCTYTIEIPSAGTFMIDLTGDGSQCDAWLTDSSGKILGNPASLSEKSKERTLIVRVKKSGKYTIHFATEEKATVQADFYAYYAPAADMDIAFDKLYYGSGAVPAYFKVTVPSTGYMTVEIPECMINSVFYNLEILDKNKKRIKSVYDKQMDGDCNYTGYIGVSKGTYYIAVDTVDPAYGIRISFQSVKEKSGSSRAKAVKLSKGYSKSGVFGKTDSQDWYKFTISKKQKVTFTVSTKAGFSGYKAVRFAFYKKGSSKMLKSETLSQSNSAVDVKLSSPRGATTLKAGTYYVKVSGSPMTGYYSLKWIK